MVHISNIQIRLGKDHLFFFFFTKLGKSEENAHGQSCQFKIDIHTQRIQIYIILIPLSWGHF